MDWRWALPRVAVLFIATRMLVLVVAVAVEVTQPDHPAEVNGHTLVTSLTVWDGKWFLGIAENGYHAEVDGWPDYAFFPFYPVVTKAASLLTLGDTAIAG